MENFFYNDEFYTDLESFISDNFEDEKEIMELEEGVYFKCKTSRLEPIIQLSAEWIADQIYDERYSEFNEEKEREMIKKALLDNIDFEKINSLIPKLHYENYREEFKITKKDLIHYIS